MQASATVYLSEPEAPRHHRLAATLQRFECAAERGERLTGLKDHRGAAKAYRHALRLLVEEFPDAAQVAVAVLDVDRDAALRTGHRDNLLAWAAAVSSAQSSLHDEGLAAAFQTWSDQRALRISPASQGLLRSLLADLAEGFARLQSQLRRGRQ